MPNPQDLLDCHGCSFISKLVSFAFVLRWSMLLKFEAVCLLVSHLSIDVCVSLVNIVDATVLYFMCGISTGYDIIVIGFFAGEQYVPVLERWRTRTSIHQETKILT